MGQLTFVKNQYAKETTKGTAVASAKRWLGSVTIPDDRTPVHPEYALAQRAQSHATEILQLSADPVALEMPKAYFQGLPLVFGITLKGAVTATEHTASQGDYDWDFTPSLTAAGNPDAATLQSGDNDQAYQIEYTTGRKISIDWTMGDNAAIGFKVDAFGRQVTPITFTAGINPLTANLISANSCKMWLDSTWANLGTTLKTGALRGGSIEIDTGNAPDFLAAGTQYWNTVAEGFLSVVGNLRLSGAEAVSRLTDHQAGTHRAVRLSWTGPQIGSGTNHSLIVDMFIAFDKVLPLNTSVNGQMVYAVTFSGVSDNLATPHMLGVKCTTNSNTY